MWQFEAPFVGWAIASVLLGLGFTFFSGATEAWLVDALTATGYEGDLESVFGKAQVVGGAAMLIGSVSGGIVAQATNLGVPYLLRAGFLGVALGAAWWFMRDLGFTPKKDVSPVSAVRDVVNGAVDGGLRNPPVRWLMLAAPFTVGVGFYAFYAIQPYLLELYGDPDAYALAGVAAAILAGAQIVGGFAVRWVRRIFRTRTGALLLGLVIEVVLLAGIGLTSDLVVALAFITGSAIAGALTIPIRQAFLNPLIPSEQRATVLSFDSLMGSIGGVVAQPALGRVADVSGYAASYLVSAGVAAVAIPFIALSRRERAPSDPMATRSQRLRPRCDSQTHLGPSTRRRCRGIVAPPGPSSAHDEESAMRTIGGAALALAALVVTAGGGRGSRGRPCAGDRRRGDRHVDARRRGSGWGRHDRGWRRAPARRGPHHERGSRATRGSAVAGRSR